MSETRRTVLTLALVGVLATTGCIGFLTGSESLEFDASEATVADATVEEQEYSEVRVEPLNIEREFTAAGQTRTVNVTNYLAEYSRAAEVPVLGTEQEVARFIAFSSPQVSFAGQTLNPIDDWSNEELLRRVQGSYSSLENIETDSSYTVDALGDERNVTKFSGDATFNGQSIPVYIHVTKFAHDGESKDIIAGIAIYPQRLDEDSPTEESRVKALIEGLQH